MYTKLLNVSVLVLTISTMLSCGDKDSMPAIPDAVSDKASARVLSYVPQGEASYFNINTSFYKKYIQLGSSTISIPIVAPAYVSDQALEKAAVLCEALCRTYPSYAIYGLRQQKIYVAVFGNTDYPNVLPGWPAGVDATRYGGGFGPTTSFRVCGIHEGDILKNSYDRYPGENIVVHEFSHAVKNFALETYDATFRNQIQTLYQNARAAGKWTNTYAAVNAEEYYAECVQSYFNVNQEGRVGGDGVHNQINTRSELGTYDAGITNLLNNLYNRASLPPGNW